MNQPSEQMNEPTKRVMRACASTYAAPCGIWALILVLSIAVAILKHPGVEAIGISLAILGLTVMWVSSFKIEVSSAGITYRSPFFRHAAVGWSNITSVRTGVRLHPTKPPFYMVIERNDSREPLTINIKVFGKADLSMLAAAIRRWSPQATVDKTTLRMSGGEMPSMLRATSPNERTG